MPISIETFESEDWPAELSVPELVVGFLAANRDHAFTRAELADALDATPNAVGTALSRLKDRGLVRHRGSYWAITDDWDRVEAAYDLHRAMETLDEAAGGIEPAAWDEAAPDEPHPSERQWNR